MITHTDTSTKCHTHSLSLTVEVPKSLDGQGDLLRQAIAAALYKKGDLTMKEARELLGNVSRRDFEEKILPAFGYAIMDDSTSEELQTELDVLEKIT